MNPIINSIVEIVAAVKKSRISKYITVFRDFEIFSVFVESFKASYISELSTLELMDERSIWDPSLFNLIYSSDLEY